MHCKTEFVRNSKIKRKNDSKKTLPSPGAFEEPLSSFRRIWGTPVLIPLYPKATRPNPRLTLSQVVGPPQCPAKPKDTEDLHPISKHIPHVSDFLLLWGGGRDDEPMLRYVKNSGTLSSLSTRALTQRFKGPPFLTMHCKTEFVRNSKIRRKNDSKKTLPSPGAFEEPLSSFRRIWGTPVLIPLYPKATRPNPRLTLSQV